MYRDKKAWTDLASKLDCFHSVDPDTGDANGLILHLENDQSRYQFSIEKVDEEDYFLTAGISMRWPSGDKYQSPEIHLPMNLTDAQIQNIVQRMKLVLTKGNPLTTEEGDAIASELGQLNHTWTDDHYLENPANLEDD